MNFMISLSRLSRLAGKVLSRHKHPLLLICVLTASGCGTSGPFVCPDPPKMPELPELPSDRMATPQYRQRLSDEFFGSGTTPTTKSDGSSPN